MNKLRIKLNRMLVCLIAACVMLCSCSNSEYLETIIAEDSHLIGWYVDCHIVYMVCRLIIDCQEKCTVSINALSEEDRGKLLQSPQLTGYNVDMSETVFNLTVGRNDVIVVFVGVFGAVEKKADDNVPDIIKLDVIK